MKMHTSNMEKNIPDSAQLVLLNVSSFNSLWARGNGNSLMKVYNSFGYTQDVHYEARILELPLRDKDFKLVVIAPNNVDLLHTLFRRLSNDGLRAAICNIQPVFTVESKLMVPQIQFDSEESYDIKLGKLGPVTITQCGTTNVSEQGAQFNVMTYLYIKRYAKDPIIPEEWSSKHPPFFFGLVYQDTPVFTGQFNYIVS